MASLDPGGLERWLRDSQERTAPEHYTLVPPGEVIEGLLTQIRQRIANIAPESQAWITGSGISFSLAGLQTSRTEPVTQELSHALRALCVQLDEREYIEVERNHHPAATVVLEMTSSIDGRPVLGPGGRLTLYTDRQGLSGEVCIRRRSRRPGGRGRWRDPSRILNSLRRPIEAGPTFLDAEIGYFEMSRFETQTLMRPTYMFTVVREQPSLEPTPGWAEVVVTPATDIEGLGPDDGLDGWETSDLADQGG